MTKLHDMISLVMKVMESLTCMLKPGFHMHTFFGRNLGRASVLQVSCFFFVISSTQSFLTSMDLAVPVEVSYKGVSDKKNVCGEECCGLYFLFNGICSIKVTFNSYTQFYEKLLYKKLVLGQSNG